MFVGLFAEVRAVDSSDPQQCAERSLPGARQSTGESIYPSQFRYCTEQTRCFRQEALQRQNCVHLSALSYRAGVKHAFPALQTSAKTHCLLLLQKSSTFVGFFALIIGGVACNLFQTEYVLNHGVSQACTEKKQGCFLQMMRCKMHCGWLKPPQGTFLLLRPAQLKIQLRFLGCDFESCCSSACNLPGLCSVQSKILLSG